MADENRVQIILSRLNACRSDVLKLLHFLRVSKDEEYDSLWQRNVVLYQEFAKALISAGHYNKGFALAHEGMIRHDRDGRLRYLCAQALARMGVIAKADQYVRELLHIPDQQLKVDAWSLAGRLQKDRYLRAEKVPARQRAMGGIAAEAANLYKTAYDLSPDIFPAINAATMYMLAGDARRARELADQILSAAAARPHDESDYWLFASLGEARLLRHEWDEATECYQRAVRLCGGRLGDLASMRGNIRLLNRRMSVPEAVLDLFHLGTVVAFAGEMADNPYRHAADRPTRFPLQAELEHVVSEEIRKRLDALKAEFGYCCPRAGCDILFAEQMLQRGGEIHLVLPFHRDDFFDMCVNFGLGDRFPWHQRCQRLLDQSDPSRRGGKGRVVVHHATTERYMNDDVLFDFLHTFIQGLAIAHAAQYGVTPHGLVVYDAANPDEQPGACARFLDSWNRTGLAGNVIEIGRLRDARAAAITTVAEGGICPPSATTESDERRELKAMLFADVKNFSMLSDDVSPVFFLNFTKQVKAAIDASGRPPIFCNTWGDGLFAVFDAVHDAADFAVRLLDQVGGVRWREQGVPDDMDVRIGMHVGPVYRRADPILGRDNFYGSHVNRAARIEPVTTPGCAFVSEQFAAALSLDPKSDFICTPVGIERLAKGYDTCPVYCLGRR